MSKKPSQASIDELKSVCEASEASHLPSLVWFSGVATKPTEKDYVAINIDSSTSIEVPIASNPEVYKQEDDTWRIGVKYGTKVIITDQRVIEISQATTDCNEFKESKNAYSNVSPRRLGGGRRRHCWCYSKGAGRYACVCCTRYNDGTVSDCTYEEGTYTYR